MCQIPQNTQNWEKSSLLLCLKFKRAKNGEKVNSCCLSLISQNSQKSSDTLTPVMSKIRQKSQKSSDTFTPVVSNSSK